MLWNDFSEKPVRSRVSVVAGVPQTGWEAPREFPNLSGAKVLAIDTESYDPELLDNGAGWARNRSHMVGASIATDDGHSWYFPIRHSVCPEQNMPVEPVIRFLKDVLETPNVAKVGANLLYDVGMLQHEGVHVKGALWDVQYAEALLVEQGRVNLDHLASKYLGKHKETSLLYEWSQQSYGGDINDQRANIHRCPPSLVGKYAEADASLPLEVFPHVWKELHKQGLHKLYRMECELIPLYVAMRYAGVRVDLEAAEILSHDLTQAYNTERFKLYDVAGFEVNVNSGDDLAKLFDSQGLHYPITETGKPSFVKDWLNQHEAPLAQQIVEVRKLLKLRDTFVDKIRNVNIDGKLYPQFHPLRGTGGGTRSGRYSSSGDMNVQQIPSRDSVWSKRIRGLFVPDIGHKYIRKYDYQAIEYRFLAHFAVGAGADELRKAYNDNPHIDYHNIVMDMVAPVAGWDVSTAELKAQRRKPLKTINFGIVFGMGEAKLSRSLGLSHTEGKDFLKQYHQSLPYAKATMKACGDFAESNGYIDTILGRRSRFEMFEPIDWADQNDKTPLPWRSAIGKYGYGNVRLTGLHKALNRRLQGSAADLLKKALHKSFTEGVFDRTGLPRLLVHDEILLSLPEEYDTEALNEMQHIFETALPLRVPILFEGEQGTNWGNTKALP